MIMMTMMMIMKMTMMTMMMIMKMIMMMMILNWCLSSLKRMFKKEDTNRLREREKAREGG